MSHNTLPSPSSKTTNMKRPYESNTPSALGTPKDTSAQSMRSPGQAAPKKARTGEDGSTNPPKELSKGGQWMVTKLEELERMYKEVLLAATAVIQYQTYALRLGKKVRKIPIHLERRVKISWGNFEATRRHVQAYMLEAAQDASTPSSRNAPIAVPLPPPSATLSVSDLPADIPLTSPIPLSAATMLSFQPDQANLATTTPAGATIPKYETEIPPQPVAENYAFNMLSSLPGNDAGMGNLDLSNISMGDLAGLMGTGDFDFSSLAPQVNNQLPDLSNQIQAQGQSQVQGQNQIQPQVQIQAQPQTQPTQNQVMPNTNVDTTGQSDTDRLLAQLGELSGVSAGNGLNVQSNTVSDDDVNALLASLGETTDTVPDFSNFDFGDMDLSNLGDMSGLFNTSTAPTEVAQQQTTNLTPAIPQADQAAPSTQQQQVQGGDQANNTNISDLSTIPPPDSKPIVNDPVDPNLDLSNVFDETQAIDLDDFNFGDSEQTGEGGVGMNGDEFESLLAAFN